jgi:serine/threonine protein kinase
VSTSHPQYVNYLSWKRRLQMLHDVASGMLYLHSRRYVHGDLRSPNLFVTENGRVRKTRARGSQAGRVS